MTQTLIQAATNAMDTQDTPKAAGSQTTASTSTLPEAEAYATLLVAQYLVDNKLCSEVGQHMTWTSIALCTNPLQSCHLAIMQQPALTTWY